MGRRGTTILEPLRPLAEGQVACADCGVSVQRPSGTTRTATRQQEVGDTGYHRDVAFAEPVVTDPARVVWMPSDARSLWLEFSRCDGCADRYAQIDRLVAATPWMPGDQHAVAERLLAAAASMGYTGGGEPVATLRAADLNDRDAGLGPVGLAVFAERRIAGQAATAPWSFMSAEERELLAAIPRRAVARRLAAAMPPPPPIPCPPPAQALAETRQTSGLMVGGGCLCCGLGALAVGRVEAPTDYDPWRSEEENRPSTPTWTPHALDARAVTGRGSSQYVIGHMCPTCTAPLADGTAGVGPSLIDAVLGAELKLPPDHSTDGVVKFFAARVLDARRNGQPEPTGHPVKFGWLRGPDGELPTVDFGASPEPDREPEPTTAELIATAVAEAKEQLRAELAPPVVAAQPEPPVQPEPTQAPKGRWRAKRDREGRMTSAGIAPGTPAPRPRIDYRDADPQATTKQKRQELLAAMQVEESARRRR